MPRRQKTGSILEQAQTHNGGKLLLNGRWAKEAEERRVSVCLIFPQSFIDAGFCHQVMLPKTERTADKSAVSNLNLFVWLVHPAPSAAGDQ